MSEELKPCPFCGGEARLNDAVVVECETDNCFGNAVDEVYFETAKEAVKAWNVRTDTQQVEQLRKELEGTKRRYDELEEAARGHMEVSMKIAGYIVQLEQKCDALAAHNKKLHELLDKIDAWALGYQAIALKTGESDENI